jgi:lipopolysaccharide export system protein LptA
MKIYKLYLAFALLLIQKEQLFGQNVIIRQTEVFRSGVFKDKKINKLLGKVILTQKDMTLYCDSAYQYVEDKNTLETFGRVKLVKSDTITLNCDKLTYDGFNKMAKARNNVVLRDPGMTLYTDYLDFDLDINTAFYYRGGRILNGDNILTSEKGAYNTGTKMMHFKDSVHLISPGREMFSDTMDYHTESKVVYFTGPTRIISENGIVYTEDGEYNTVSKISSLGARNRLENEEYIMEADDMIFERNGNSGRAEGNVFLYSKTENIILTGDHMTFGGENAPSKLWGNTLMLYPMEEDTLLMRADTLISQPVDSSEDRKIIGFYNVRIFKPDLQGICDSMVYNSADSMIIFFDDPVIWADKNQMTADTISIQMANGRIDKVYMDINAFIISEDTIGNFNQVKGRHVTAEFDSAFIRKVIIDGNGESIYFALKEEDLSVVGMNRVICSNMILDFTNEELEFIRFYVQPDSKFIPPQELMDPEKRLRGFLWRESEKPDRETVLYYETLNQ